MYKWKEFLENVNGSNVSPQQILNHLMDNFDPVNLLIAADYFEDLEDNLEYRVK